MADREIHTIDRDRGGMGGMGAILGMILGVLLVGGLIFFFASNWDRTSDTQLTINPPAATGSATTGSGTAGSAPRAPAAPSAPAQ